jgi:hypothetical protein
MSQKEINELLAKINGNSAFNNENNNHDDSVKKKSNIRSSSVLEPTRSASAFPVRNTPINRSLNTHLKTSQYIKRYGTNANVFNRSRTAIMFNYSSMRSRSVFSPISRKNDSSQSLLSKDVPVEYDGNFNFQIVLI